MMELVIITGLSGSGKSLALAVLEDAGYYCVDNLPVRFVPELITFLAGEHHRRIGLSIDVRSGQSLKDLPHYLGEMRTLGVDVKVLFLDAQTDTLLQRFSETRRRHPLSDGKLTLPECIANERELLQEVADLAHHIDTSELNPNALRGWVADFVHLEGAGLTLLFQSFGYKHGIPLDADLVFDVRCLPNPHYDPRLRPLTGKDKAVIEFLQAEKDVARLLADIRRFVADWLPCFKRDNRSYLTVAIGCTGGRHRSVYFAEALAEHFSSEQRVLVRHRELV